MYAFIFQNLPGAKSYCDASETACKLCYTRMYDRTGHHKLARALCDTFDFKHVQYMSKIVECLPLCRCPISDKSGTGDSPGEDLDENEVVVSDTVNRYRKLTGPSYRRLLFELCWQIGPVKSHRIFRLLQFWHSVAEASYPLRLCCFRSE